MPTELLEHQHEVTTEDGTLSLVFGTADTGYLTTSYPVISGTDGQTGDVARVREDGVAMGEDYTAGKSVAFEVSVLQDGAPDPIQAGADALADFEAVWKNKELRNRSTKFAILRSCVGGRTRRAYGRPRRYDELAGSLTTRGITPVVCDFFVPDSKWYDDEEQFHAFTGESSNTSGLASPLVTPLTTTAFAETSSGIVIGGKQATWPVVTFHGPIDTPSVTFNDGLTIGLNASLSAGQSVTIDPRPWRRTATRNEDGANMAGLLTWETPPMKRMSLEPGRYDVVLRGEDPSGTAMCSIAWRAAYPRW